MRITVPHYFDFGEERRLVGDDLVRPEAWDAIRTESNGAFALPIEREEWERRTDQNEAIAGQARRIDEILAEREAADLASYGVGAAFLELGLHRLRPGRPLTLGDYAPATVERLRGLFPEADVHQHDLRTDDPLPRDWHLFSRIDTEFSNREWREILERFSGRFVLVVVGDLIDWRRGLAELRLGLANRNATRSGRVRNRAAFEALWRRTHDAEAVTVHDLQGWVLSPRT